MSFEPKLTSICADRPARESALSLPPHGLRRYFRFGRVLPCERQRLSERVFIERVQSHLRGACASPGSVLGSKHGRVPPHEFLLLFRRELDHAPFVIVMERREDLAVRAEVGMSH